MAMEEIYEDMKEEFERNHPLITEMYKRYKTFQDIADEWREIRKPITITEASDRTEVDYESVGIGTKVIEEVN